MTTKEFANMFGMSVNEMCEYIGLSRQGLNEIVKGNSTKNSEKKRDARHALRELAASIRQEDFKAAENQYRERVETAYKLFNTF